MKSKSGITLIALVITVIVLLILAGVSISLVVGNNGVLTQASNAVIENRKASAREDVEMAWASAEADYWSNWAKGSSTEKNPTYYEDKIPGYLNNTGTFISLGYEEQNGKYEYEVKYQKNGIEYTFIVDANGKVRVDGEGTAVNTGETGTESGSGSETEGSSIVTTYTVTFYANSGYTTVYDTKIVNSGESIGSNNMPEDPTKDNYIFAGWKKESDDSEFTASITISSDTRVYADWTADPIAGFGTANPDYTSNFGKKVSGYSPSSGSNWRLFYADSNFAYLISDSIGNKALNDSTMTGFGGDMTSSAFALGRNLNSKYTTSGNWSSNRYNIKGVAALLDTSRWTDYKTSDAEWAIGGPTLELFIASYNSTHSNQLYCSIPEGSTVGYRVGNKTPATAYSISNLGNSQELDKAVYAPSSGSQCCWWLASPSDEGAEYVMRLYSTDNGTLEYAKYGSSNHIRPLVCVSLSKIGDGTGQISITDSY